MLIGTRKYLHALRQQFYHQLSYTLNHQSKASGFGECGVDIKTKVVNPRIEPWAQRSSHSGAPILHLSVSLLLLLPTQLPSCP